MIQLKKTLLITATALAATSALTQAAVIQTAAGTFAGGAGAGTEIINDTTDTADWITNLNTGTTT